MHSSWYSVVPLHLRQGCSKLAGRIFININLNYDRIYSSAGQAHIYLLLTDIFIEAEFLLDAVPIAVLPQTVIRAIRELINVLKLL